MKFRKLRIAFSATCLIACVLLIVLWVRSYAHVDCVTYIFAGSRMAAVESKVGRVYLSTGESCYPPGYTAMQSKRLDDDDVIYDFKTAKEDGFKALIFPSEYCQFPKALRLQHWYVVSFFIALGAIPWIRWSRRFSLRTLLIATTLIAVVLGLAVYAARK
jgi:hypothetical protein